ncbi:MAG: hypothetical protein ACE14M_02575 [Terriglobales bacterium]
MANAKTGSLAWTSTEPTQATHIAAAQHVSEAHQLLERLRNKPERHPDMDEAIEQLERALSALTIKDGRVALKFRQQEERKTRASASSRC